MHLEPGTIELHQYPAAWGRIPSLGQFCVKVATYMRMVGLPYTEVPAMHSDGPLSKLPFIRHGERLVADSEVILEYLESLRDVPLDAWLSRQQRAEAHALRRMLEEHTYFTSVWFRWGEDRAWPHMESYWQDFMGDAAAGWLPKARKYMQSQLWQQGIARHDSRTILSRAEADIDVLADRLERHPFLLGEEPSSVDASAYGILEALLDSPWDAPEAELIVARPSVEAYVERIRGRYWSTWGVQQPRPASHVDQPQPGV